MGNSWHEVPMLAGDNSIVAALLSAGTKVYRKGNLKLLFSPLEQHPDGLWKHASVSHHARYPTWDEILDVRYLFFGENDDVVQILPPKGEYVNVAQNCFHLWSPIGKRVHPL